MPRVVLSKENLVMNLVKLPKVATVVINSMNKRVKKWVGACRQKEE